MNFLHGFEAGVASLFVAQLVFNYNFSDWVKDKVLALIGWIKAKL